MKLAYGLPFHHCPPKPAFLSGAALAQLGRAAEDAGFTAAYLTEHPAPAEPWRQSGGHDALDPFVGLSFVAAATTRLRLLTYLIVLPYRNPFLLAKSVASLDVLSGGRVELGMGTGYMKGEFHALGVDFDERNALFDEALQVIRMTWSGETVTYQGLHFSARDIRALPRPAQDPHPPLWLGGNSKLTRRRAVDHGAGWMPMPNTRSASSRVRSPALESMEDLAEMMDYMRSYADEVGRPVPSEIMFLLPNVAADDVTAMRAHVDLVAQAADAGITWMSVNGQGETMAEATDFIARYHDNVISRLGEHAPDAQP